MKKTRNRKRIILLSIIGLALVISILLGISYAAFRARVSKLNETNTKIGTKTITSQVVYDNFNCSNIIPGDQCTKKFTISNTSNRTLKYNIYMEKTINEFYGNLNDFVYTLKMGDTVLVDQAVVPETNADKQYIKVGVEIPANTTKQFDFVIDYIYLPDKDQSAYQGSEFDTMFGADAEEINITCDNQCNGECPKVGDILDDDDTTCPKYVTKVIEVRNNTYCTDKVKNPKYPCSSSTPKPVPPTETDEQCLERIEDERVYGTEIAIHHDIYYSDQTLYSTGKNERFVTYCTPFRDSEGQKVLYCPKANHKGKCKKVNRATCSYENAIKDLGYESTKYQTRVEYFADQGNGNWHIQTYCQTKGKKTKWPGNGNGIYYCDSEKEKLHDWYSESTSNSDNLSFSTCRSYFYFDKFLITDRNDPYFSYYVTEIKSTTSRKDLYTNHLFGGGGVTTWEDSMEYPEHVIYYKDNNDGGKINLCLYTKTAPGSIENGIEYCYTSGNTEALKAKLESDGFRKMYYDNDYTYSNSQDGFWFYTRNATPSEDNHESIGLVSNYAYYETFLDYGVYDGEWILVDGDYWGNDLHATTVYYNPHTNTFIGRGIDNAYGNRFVTYRDTSFTYPWTHAIY